jgi:hypothetical protein
MAATLFSNLILANSDGGLIFAFEQSTLPGKVVLAVLFLGSVFSWSVMLSKLLTLMVAKKQRELFLDLFRQDRQPLRLYAEGLSFEGAPVFAIYEAGCVELSYQLLGSTELDESFGARLDSAQRITPSQMRVVAVALERAVGESSLKL